MPAQVEATCESLGVIHLKPGTQRVPGLGHNPEIPGFGTANKGKVRQSAKMTEKGRGFANTEKRRSKQTPTWKSKHLAVPSLPFNF